MWAIPTLSLCRSEKCVILESLFFFFPFYTGPLRAPKWYKRPAGASFGFGGKIVSFHPGSSGAGASSGVSEVSYWHAACIFYYELMIHYIAFSPVFRCMCTAWLLNKVWWIAHLNLKVQYKMGKGLHSGLYVTRKHRSLSMAFTIRNKCFHQL